ncbi:MAG: DUF452 family protein [Staphylococcus sp.]|nr:DUF452 family protein [Staphylococcus sp.]
MKFHILPTSSPIAPNRTILIFAGWGMDEKPFARLAVEGYRIAIVWDYRRTDFPTPLAELLAVSEEIVVLAWSFGVSAATRFIIANPQLPLTARIAVNGTMHPVDDRLGIPPPIFDGTLDGLSEKSLSKFYLRMAGSGEAFRKFAGHMPDRDIPELKEELIAIDSAPAVGYGIRGIWDCALISDSDRIIPPANQKEAWSAEPGVEIINIPGAHLPDFGSILRSLVKEKGLVAQKFTRAEATYDDNALVQHRIAEKLCGLIPGGMSGGNYLEIGCGTGLATRLLISSLTPSRLTLWDLHIPEALTKSLEADGHAVTALECDAETEIRQLPDESLDLIFSASTVQWFNSLPTFLRECSRKLRKGCVAVISTFGPETMREIRGLLPDSIHYPELRTISAMIPAGCTLIHLSEEVHSLTFPSPLEALRHAKLTGVNGLSSTHNGSTARDVISRYPLTPDGKATVTYHPIYILLQKK